MPSLAASVRLVMSEGRRRRGAALLVAMFVMVVASMLALAVLDAQTMQLTALRNTAEYQRALYLAAAAAEHVCAELESDAGWRRGLPETELPAGSGDRYLATLVDNGDGTLTITAVGMAGGASRRLQVVVDLEN